MSGIVGRAAELRVVTHAVDTVSGGRGLVLSISGEPGIGKSTIARAALQIAERQGFRTLQGTAGRFLNDLTYAPVLQALRPLVDDPAPSDGTDLTAGLVELSLVFTDLPMGLPAPTHDRGLERSRLVEAICRLVQRAAARAPIAVLIDIHWADTASLDLIGTLALNLADHPCLIITTDRGDPTAESVRRFRAPLRRLDRLVDLHLGPLTSDGVRDLAAATLGGDPPDAVLDLLNRRARGVPYYVSALVESLRDRGRLFRSAGRWVLGPGDEDRVPQDVAEIIADRLDELAPADMDILAGLGVWGGAVPATWIAALVEDVDALPGRLDALTAAGLVQERSTGTTFDYVAHHPLVVETAYSRLSPRERRRRHAAAAAHLRTARDPDLARLAHHVRLAGPEFDPDRALTILTTATMSGSPTVTGSEAHLLAEAAAALVRQAGRNDLLPRALERVAETATTAGNMAAAMTGWREAADEHGDDVAAASRCLRRLALLQLEDGAARAAVCTLDEAFGLLPDGADPERIRVLKLRVAFHIRNSDWTRFREDLDGLRAADALDDLPPGLADILDRFERDQVGRPTVSSAAARYVETASRTIGAIDDEARLLVVPWLRPWIVDAIARGDLELARQRARTSADLPTVSPSLRSSALALEGLADWLSGHPERAWQLTGQALVMAHRHDNHRSISLALTIAGLILAQRADLDRADACLADARHVVPDADHHLIGAMDTVTAVIALQRGHTVTALAALDQAPFTNHLGLVTLTTLITAAVAGGRMDLVERVERDLARIDGPWSAALARRASGLRHTDTAAQVESFTRLDDLGLVLDAAYGRLELAELHPDHSDAVTVAEAALAVFERVGTLRLADRARRTLRRQGRRPAPGRRGGSVLSSRERQVAELVAQGLSNADVAARLFISPRTVTTHLERIYRRLNITSRTELARHVSDVSASGGIRSQASVVK